MAQELSGRRAVPAGGRNKRVPGGRTHVTKVMMTPEERARVQARAANLGISVPRALVEAAIGVPPLTRREREVLYGELNRLKFLLANLTNNANQIARALNSDVEVPPAMIRSVLERAESTVERVEALAEEFRVR
ncbi:plasmid mobilization protein [Streptomyces sp. NPDC090442]|uniref:plasmid mobilization protein n=1 Tax=Streptomyces sp. NPDC090442 TaxID=3365962 RepID=UPI0037FF95AC